MPLNQSTRCCQRPGLLLQFRNQYPFASFKAQAVLHSMDVVVSFISGQAQTRQSWRPGSSTCRRWRSLRRRPRACAQLTAAQRQHVQLARGPSSHRKHGAGFRRPDCRAQLPAVGTAPGVRRCLCHHVPFTAAAFTRRSTRRQMTGYARMPRVRVAMRGHGASVQVPCRGRSFDFSWHGPMVAISGIGGMQRLQQQQQQRQRRMRAGVPGAAARLRAASRAAPAQCVRVAVGCSLAYGASSATCASPRFLTQACITPLWLRRASAKLPAPRSSARMPCSREHIG